MNKKNMFYMKKLLEPTLLLQALVVILLSTQSLCLVSTT